MFYTIYKITNQVNGKIYIGSHKTKNLDDGYMGSGKYLRRAQEKYGLDTFTKEILFVFDTPELMYAKEAELVNEDFLATENTYNLKVGGFGGWDYLNNKDMYKNPTHSSAHAKMMSDKVSIEVKRAAAKAALDQRIRLIAENNGVYPWTSPGFTGKTHTAATKEKISESAKKTSSGERNSQFGTKWIYSEELKQSKKIANSADIPEGWVLGRKIKFCVSVSLKG